MYLTNIKSAVIPNSKQVVTVLISISLPVGQSVVARFYEIGLIFTNFPSEKGGGKK